MKPLEQPTVLEILRDDWPWLLLLAVLVPLVMIGVMAL